MAGDSLSYTVTFRDFRFLQGYMARRVFARNRQKYGPALLGVVLCACFLTLAIVINVNPRLGMMLFSQSVGYQTSFYLSLIFCLLAAIVCLIPAIRLRFRMMRMQVSDDGPYIGPTKLIIEPDGLVVDRKAIRAKYFWAAFQGIEMAKNAVILPIDNGIGLIVPASAFATDADRYEFAAAISKHLKEAGPGAR
jgi:hypothetical protein